MKPTSTDKNKLKRLQLIEYVQDAFNKLERNTLNNVFVTLRMYMESLILILGENSYTNQLRWSIN